MVGNYHVRLCYLEIFDSFHFQLQSCIFIANHQGAGVLLESRHGPHVVHSFLDRLVESGGLVGAGDQNHHLKSEPTVCSVSFIRSLTTTDYHAVVKKEVVDDMGRHQFRQSAYGIK